MGFGGVSGLGHCVFFVSAEVVAGVLRQSATPVVILSISNGILRSCFGSLFVFLVGRGWCRALSVEAGLVSPPLAGAIRIPWCGFPFVFCAGLSECSYLGFVYGCTFGGTFSCLQAVQRGTIMYVCKYVYMRICGSLCGGYIQKMFASLIVFQQGGQLFAMFVS